MIKNSTEKKIKDQEKLSMIGGGTNKISIQHQKGKLTARERLDILLDHGSFIEIDKLVEQKTRNSHITKKSVPGDGVITGYGTINGRTVFVYSQDFTVIGGSLGEMHSQKINKIQDLALRSRQPIIGLNDSGGARIQEGINSLKGYGEIFQRNVNASGIIPQITLVMGPCAGGAAYSPALTDFIFMVKGTSYMYLTGPDVVKAATYETVTHEDLGGSEVHCKKSGICDLLFDNDIDCLNATREFLDYLPSSNVATMPVHKTNDSVNRIDTNLDGLISSNESKPYDIKKIILTIVDEENFVELKESFACNIVIGFARFAGKTVGIVANQPMEMAGCLDINASTKAARFVRFCDAFSIPILSLVDVPGFLPGTDQEYKGIIKHGAKLLFAFAEATVPKITIIIRKAYGGAYVVMGSKHIGNDINLSWYNTKISVMNAETASTIIHKNHILSTQAQQEFHHMYEKKISSPLTAASMGYLDEIIQPSTTRLKVCRYLDLLQYKKIDKLWKKHDNLPL